MGELVFEDNSLIKVRREYGRILADEGYRYQYYLSCQSEMSLGKILSNTRVVLQ